MIYTAHEYQAFCIWACINLPALALWLECGLGKTIITLTAIMELKYNRLTVSKVLIIAPKKVSEAYVAKRKRQVGTLENATFLNSTRHS